MAAMQHASSGRARALADRFLTEHNKVVELVKRIPEDRWRSKTPEGWTAAATAHHIGRVYLGHANLIRAIIDGKPVAPIWRNWSQLHQVNAEAAAMYAWCTREEVLTLFTRNSAQAAETVRALTDDQLALTAPVPILGERLYRIEQLVELLLIRHVSTHLRSLEAATSN